LRSWQTKLIVGGSISFIKFCTLAVDIELMNQELTKSQQETCVYTGIFGVLLGVTCLIQLIAITREHWLTFVLLGSYLFSIASMVLLAMQRAISPILLIVSSVLVFAINVILILLGVFSLIAFIYLIYLVAIITVLFVGQYPSRMRAMALARRAEEKEWAGKI
jgi:hypothetical protein